MEAAKCDDPLSSISYSLGGAARVISPHGPGCWSDESCDFSYDQFCRTNSVLS